MNQFEKYCPNFVQSVGDKEGAVFSTVVNSVSFTYNTPEIEYFIKAAK